MEEKAMDSGEFNLVEELSKVDEEIQRLEDLKEFHEMMKDLQTNKSFIRVINEGYLTDEKNRLMELMIEPLSPSSNQDFKDYVEKIHGIRHFRSYLEYAFRTSAHAEMKIEDAKEYRKSITSEHAATAGEEE